MTKKTIHLLQQTAPIYWTEVFTTAKKAQAAMRKALLYEIDNCRIDAETAFIETTDTIARVTDSDYETVIEFHIEQKVINQTIYG